MSAAQVKMAVFLTYLKAVGALLSFIIVLFYILYNAASIYSNVWLSEWSNDARSPNATHDPEQRSMRLGVYGALGVLQGRLSCLSFLSPAQASIRSLIEPITAPVAKLGVGGRFTRITVSLCHAFC